VDDRRTLLRVELALGALGLTVALLAATIALDVVRHHLAGPTGAAAVVLGLLDAVVVARAAGSLTRQLRAGRRFLRTLPVREVVLHRQLVRVFPGPALGAFCAGLLRPHVYLSQGTLDEVGAAELRAILAHEAHHRARRDPLRLLLARVVTDALRPLPPFAALASRHAALADLAADAAAVRALGDVTPLASALVRFDQRAGTGVAPERVDRLVGEAPPHTVPAWLLAAAGVAIAGLAALAPPMLLSGWHPDPALPGTLELAMVIAACTPACLAASCAGACLRPVG
jgi:hypothetical protein